MRPITIPEGRAPVPLQVGSIYLITFTPPAGFTAEMEGPAIANIGTAIAPNTVHTLFRDSVGNIVVRVGVVRGGHLYSTAVLRNRVIGAVAATAAGQAVNLPPEYTYDPNTGTWTLAPLDITRPPETILNRWGGVLAVGAIIVVGAMLVRRDRRG